MNPRERVLAVLLVCFIILGGGGAFGYYFGYLPYKKKTAELARLASEASTKDARLAAINEHRAKLERWKSISLPGEPDVARGEYEKYLNDLVSKNGIAPGRYQITPGRLDKQNVPTTSNKEPIYTRLTYI